MKNEATKQSFFANNLGHKHVYGIQDGIFTRVLLQESLSIVHPLQIPNKLILNKYVLSINHFPQQVVYGVKYDDQKTKLDKSLLSKINSIYILNFNNILHLTISWI